MIAFAVGLAVAGPLDDASPLPPCSPGGTSGSPTPGESLQLQLGAAVTGLAFHPVSGDLIVVDWGGLTVRDPSTLAVKERWLPGVDGWIAMHPGLVSADGQPGELSIENTLGLRAVVDLTKAAPIQLRAEPWSEAEVREPDLWVRTGTGGVVLLGHPPTAALVDGVIHEWRDDALGAVILALDPEPPRTERLAPPGRSALEAVLPRSGGGGADPRVTAVAVDPSGDRLAVATRRSLMIADLRAGAVLARAPLVGGLDAAALVDERLVTVADGALTLWSGAGAPSWTAPGVQVSMAPVGRGKLLVSGLDGQISLLDLRRGTTRPRSCPAGACDATPPGPTLPPPPPSSESDEATLRAWRATVLAAHEQTRADLDALQGRPISLSPAGRWVVAAELEPGPWRKASVEVPRRLWVLDRRGRRVLAARDLDPARPLAPRFVAPDAVVLGEDAYHLPDLAPLPVVPRPPDQTVEVAIEPIGRFDRVVVGRWLGGEHVGLRGLPARWVPQLRHRSFAVVEGDRFLVAGRGPDPTGTRGPVEVWCVPPATGESFAPGLLAAPPPTEDPRRASAASQDYLATQWERPAERIVASVTAPLVDGAAPPGAGPELRVRVGRPGDASDRVRALARDGWRVRLMLPYPPQPGELVPEGLGWGVSSERWFEPRGQEQGEVIAADTVLWYGPLERLPERLLSAGPPFGGEASADALAAWAAGPGTRDAPRGIDAEARIEVALRAGHVALARGFAQEVPAGDTSGVLRLVRRVLAVGGPGPDGIVWVDGPPPPGPRVVAVEPTAPWRTAEALPPDLPVVVLVPLPAEVERVPRALVAGVWPREDRNLALDAGTWLVVDADGIVRWAGTADGVLEGLATLQ